MSSTQLISQDLPGLAPPPSYSIYLYLAGPIASFLSPDRHYFCLFYPPSPPAVIPQSLADIHDPRLLQLRSLQSGLSACAALAGGCVKQHSTTCPLPFVATFTNRCHPAFPTPVALVKRLSRRNGTLNPTCLSGLPNMDLTLYLHQPNLGRDSN